MILKVPADADVSVDIKDVNITNLKSNLTNFKTKKLALMMPYRLDRIDTDSIEEAKEMIRTSKLLSIVLDFHEGVTMALDSAKQLGISTELKVFDTQYQPSKTRELLQDNDFSDYQTIIMILICTSWCRRVVSQALILLNLCSQHFQ